LAITERLLEDERARGQGLDAKSTTLAGFTGAILALTAALVPGVLENAGGAFAETAGRVLAGVGLAALATAAVLAILGVLRPQQRVAIAPSEIEAFGRLPLIATPRVQIQGRMINTLAEALLVDRRINDHKARLIKRTASVLAVGLICVALDALLLVTFGA
jgi:hypothetical protein